MKIAGKEFGKELLEKTTNKSSEIELVFKNKQKNSDTNEYWTKDLNEQRHKIVKDYNRNISK